MSQRNLFQFIMWLFFSDLLCDSLNCHSYAFCLDNLLCYLDNSFINIRKYSSKSSCKELKEKKIFIIFFLKQFIFIAYQIDIF